MKKCEKRTNSRILEYEWIWVALWQSNITISIYSWFSSLHIWLTEGKCWFAKNILIYDIFWFRWRTYVGTTILQEHVPFVLAGIICFGGNLCAIYLWLPITVFSIDRISWEPSICAIRGWWEQFSPSMAGFFSIPLFLFKQKTISYRRAGTSCGSSGLQGARGGQALRGVWGGCGGGWAREGGSWNFSSEPHLFEPQRAAEAELERDPGDIRKGRRNEGVQGKHAAKRGGSA